MKLSKVKIKMKIVDLAQGNFLFVKTQLTREIGYIKVKCDMEKGLGLGSLDGNISLGNWQSAASHCLIILVE